MPKNATKIQRTVKLPYERATKNFLVYSTLESRDRDKAKDDPAVVNKVYVRQDTFGSDKPEAIQLTVEAA